jgi:hypothetical protein
VRTIWLCDFGTESKPCSGVDRFNTIEKSGAVSLSVGAGGGATERALNWLGYVMQHGLALMVVPSLDIARGK